MPLVQTRGAASAQGFGEFAQQTAVNYIEDVFSTYLYTGNSSTQTITNGIDLSTKGGLVWIKRRTSEAHYLFDTSRGALVELNTDGLDGDHTKANSLTAFNTTGFSLGSWGGSNYSVAPDNSYVSWTFRKQPKFFDVVTYTGDGTSPRTVAHNLGSAPGMMFIKRTDSTSNWSVNAFYLAANEYLNLNTTAAKVLDSTYWAGTRPSSTVFTLGTNSEVNASGGTYIAYLFAHNAGGFGLAGTDNVISCGSFTTDGSGNATVSLGYEPQWVIEKSSTATNNWIISDTMREMSNTSDAYFFANLSNAEVLTGYPHLVPTATGFTIANHSSSTTYIYIAIRRGPMKVPTTGTQVYMGAASAATTPGFTTNFPVDLAIIKATAGSLGYTYDRLRGAVYLATDTNNIESADAATKFDLMTGFYGAGWGTGYMGWCFRRAPSFFDEVCYTGTGVARTLSHNLTVVPELMIVKKRSAATGGSVYSTTIGNTQQLELFSGTGNSAAFVDTTQWNSTTPTSSVFTVGTNGGVNGSGSTYVAYLFATCAGVSKVGSYTGNGSTQTINCGFGAGGARFVLIKRTDATGDWYTYDTVRGMTVVTNPYLWLNTGAAEVASLGSVTAVSTGFALNSTILAAINTNAASYIFLAIA